MSIVLIRLWNASREPYEMMESWGFCYSPEMGLHLNWGRRYRINEMRKNVRRDQIHYFDNPAVGVLAIVTAAPAAAR